MALNGVWIFPTRFQGGKSRSVDLWSDKKPELSWATQTETGNGNGGICIPGTTGLLNPSLPRCLFNPGKIQDSALKGIKTQKNREK